MHDRRTVLLVGSGERLYREYLLESISRDHAVWLLDRDEPTWQQRYVAGWSAVDPLDPAALVEVATALARSRAVAGVVCYDEALIHPAAHVAAALCLPGMNIEAVRRCRDKLATRRALARACVPQPHAAPVTSLGQARVAAAKIRYPVVLKPRGLGASQGVVRVDDEGCLPEAYEAATSAVYPGVPTYPSILVEECVEGPEISVDGYVADGRYRILFVARKQLGLEPYFEEVAHIVDGADPHLSSPRLAAVLADTHRALGIERGITHTELRLTPTGPRVIEVNARLGGDLIPFIGLQATGIDPGTVAVAIATGTAPRVHATLRRCVGIRFCYPSASCRIESISFNPEAEVDGLVSYAAIAAAGSYVRLPPDGYAERHAYVICSGPDRASCSARLESAAAAVELVVERYDTRLASI